MAMVLVVDDDPDFVEIIRWVLLAEGHTVESAHDGDTALVRMRNHRPDLVILDVMMSSVLDGVDLARRMDDDAGLCAIPVLMVSSIADSAYASQFPTDERLPVDGWMSKPVRPQDLLRQVARLLDSEG
jgi:two-component system, OmpR family, alkaline phosphatase synthesis response regulator PhoP